MVCFVQTLEKPVLQDPVLVEGLPGIGFVANIAALHLIRELKARLFARIHSSSFQDFAVTANNGKTRSPINELYYHKGCGEESDLIILYGNTQALTTVGQYELCGCVLDAATSLGCTRVLTLGGLKRDEVVTRPKLYCAASDSKTLQNALDLGANVIMGRIFGVAGLLVGLGMLRGMKCFCLLAETPGFQPDITASREVLKAVCKTLRLKVDFTNVELAAESTRETLESFGLATRSTEKRASEESRFRWLI